VSRPSVLRKISTALSSEPPQEVLLARTVVFPVAVQFAPLRVFVEGEPRDGKGCDNRGSLKLRERLKGNYLPVTAETLLRQVRDPPRAFSRNVNAVSRDAVPFEEHDAMVVSDQVEVQTGPFPQWSEGWNSWVVRIESLGRHLPIPKHALIDHNLRAGVRDLNNIIGEVHIKTEQNLTELSNQRLVDRLVRRTQGGEY